MEPTTISVADNIITTVIPERESIRIDATAERGIYGVRQVEGRIRNTDVYTNKTESNNKDAQGCLRDRRPHRNRSTPDTNDNDNRGHQPRSPD